MFSKLALLAAASLAVFVTATPTPQEIFSCNNGPVQCCNDYQEADSDDVTALFQDLGISDVDPTTHVGITCNPINGIGKASAANCASAPLCCSNNNFNGVVALGCTTAIVGA